MGLTEFHWNEMHGGSGTIYATTGASSFGDLDGFWDPWPAAVLGWGLFLAAKSAEQSLCTPRLMTWRSVDRSLALSLPPLPLAATRAPVTGWVW
jgi:hypothetical protein